MMSEATKKKLTKYILRPEFYVLSFIVLLSLYIQLESGQFFTNNNIVDLMRAMTVPLIYAICAYLAFISTGPDVSFPLIAALSAYLATEFVFVTGYSGPIIVVFLVAIFFGLLMGAINGFIIAKYNFPALIVTLGTTSVFSGILLGVFEAGRIGLPEVMLEFGNKSILTVTNSGSGLGSSLPYTFLIAIGLYVIAYLILNYTIAGRGVYAVGGDETSAERAGFSVKKTRFWVFTINGGVAAIAGVCYSIESSYLLPTEFAGVEMIVIAAVILGGTRLLGGVGTLTGTFLGTLLLTMVANSLILVGVPIYWQKFIIGAIIIIGTAASVIEISNNKKKKKKNQNTDKSERMGVA